MVREVITIVSSNGKVLKRLTRRDMSKDQWELLKRVATDPGFLKRLLDPSLLNRLKAELTSIAVR